MTARPAYYASSKQEWEDGYRRGDWERLRGLHEAQRYSIIAGLLRLLHKKAQILDVGCGEGILAARLDPAACAFYVGVDLSETAIAMARKAGLGWRRRFFAADLADAPSVRLGLESALRFRRKVFDAIVFNEVLYHVADREAALAAYLPLLAPGGLIVVSMHDSDVTLPMWAEVQRVLGEAADTTAFRNDGAGFAWTCRSYRPQAQTFAYRVEAVNGRPFPAPGVRIATNLNGSLSLTGWALTPFGGAPKEVRVRCGEQTTVMTRVERPDVATFFNHPGLVRSGFTGSLALPSGRYDLTLQVITDRGVTHEARLGTYGVLNLARSRDSLSEIRMDAIRQRHAMRVKALVGAPLISVVVPVHDPEPRYLRQMIESVLAQVHGHWELCVADDGSTQSEVLSVLAGFSSLDPRIRHVRLDRSVNISAATNAALALARGEFVAFLDHDDELMPQALLSVAEFLAAHPEADVIYTDEATIATDGRVLFTDHKTEWQRESFLAHMYTGHLSVIRRSLLQSLGGLRSAFDGAQDYDLLLRLMERTDRILHLAEVLYRWRAAPGSTAADPEAKPQAENAELRALQDHVCRSGLHARVRPGAVGFTYRLDFDPPRELPRVSVLAFDTGDPERLLEALRSLRERSRDVEMGLTVVAGSAPAWGEVRMTDDGIRIVPEQEARSMAHVSGGNLVLLLDGILEVERCGGALAEIVSHLQLVPGGAIGINASEAARRPSLEREAFWGRLVRNGRPDARWILVRAVDIEGMPLTAHGDRILDRLQGRGARFLIYPRGPASADVAAGASRRRASSSGDQLRT